MWPARQPAARQAAGRSSARCIPTRPSNQFQVQRRSIFLDSDRIGDDFDGDDNDNFQMLETVMTINIAEFEHFYSVEENNYLTRWGKRIKKRGDLITLLLAAGFVTEVERNGWKWTLGQTSCRFSPPTTFCKKEKNWNQFQEFVNWCQFGGDLTAEFFKAANRHWLIDFSLHVDGMVGLVNVQKHSITFSIIWFYGLNIPFIHCQPILSCHLQAVERALHSNYGVNRRVSCYAGSVIFFVKKCFLSCWDPFNIITRMIFGILGIKD